MPPNIREDNEFTIYLASLNHPDRSQLLPALHKAQSVYGWLSRETLQEIGEALRVPLADIHGVVEFYTMFYNHPTARKVVRICEDPACYLGGAEGVISAIEQETGLSTGESTPGLDLTFEGVPCLGLCEHAPAGLVGERASGALSVEKTKEFLKGALPEPAAKVHGNPLWLLKRVGVVDPDSLDSYLTHGGYQGLKNALLYSPSQLTDRLDQARIAGRGGAMFPFGQKLIYTRQAPGLATEKHVIVNADESEPGTFKDRCLLEEDPFAVIEAATLAGYAAGAANGWIFVRGEYPRAFKRLQSAVKQAEEAGYLGTNILGHEGFAYKIEVRLGAGAYICGEETALFEAIEGKRGFPRIKPPFPTTHGLFNQPTAINNVETLVAGLGVLENGLDDWLSIGTEKSPGTKLFCLSGNVEKPGIYEVPFGLTIRDLIEMAGGVLHGRDIHAILMGGAAGIFIGPDQIDIELTYETLRTANIPLGSGVVQVFDDQADMRKVIYQLSRFFAHESCGKCFPCQLGTQRQVDILERAAENGNREPGAKEALIDIGAAMTETSLCGLGQTASAAVLSALRLWPGIVS